MDTVGALRLRTHGSSGRTVIVLHGGPAAAGGAVALAEGLADRFGVLEPWQRGSGAEPLTVATHVADLQALIEARCAGERPALVGESWGAMLALAFAAAHPASAAALVLVGCGTFDPAARAKLHQTLAERASSTTPYDHDLIAAPRHADEPFDQTAHEQTWADMVDLQARGVYPQAFAAITAPVLMLHGDYDPHPGPMIRDSLLPYLPHLEYRRLERCGHSPWLERHACEPFFATAIGWLEDQLRSSL